VVLAADAAAQAAGLRVGMPATKAQALVQGLVIQDADPAGDAEALDRLALWMLRRFAPIIAADAPNGIVIDSTGADHLYGDETAMLAALLEKLGSVGLSARAAIADNRGAAHALARFSARPGYVSEPGKAAGDVAGSICGNAVPGSLASSGCRAITEWTWLRCDANAREFVREASG
jgi:protein ImuB